MGWVCTENREARNVRRPTFQPGPGTRTQKQELRNLWLEIFGLTPRFCHEKLVISDTSEFCRACFGICGPELETPVWNLRAEFCSQFNEIAISDNEERAGWPFLPPETRTRKRALRSTARPSYEAASEGRTQGCPHPPHPQSTPDVARSRSHRGAAGRLGGGTNCWCGTAAAQQPAEGWCPTWAARLGVRRSASSLRVIRRAEALARRGRDHIREHLHGTQAGTPTRRLPAGVPPALRPGRSQRWLNAVPAASQRRRRACYASTFLDSKSQLSFLVSQRPGSVGDSSFLCADYRMKREFTRTIPDSYFSLRAPASVQWAL